MSSTDTTPPIRVSKASQVTLPVAVLFSLLCAGAVAYARMSSTAEQVERHTNQIHALEASDRSTREILIRIDENVKSLRREQRGGREP
jgi:outer membrane murein-binding lipoprotein Lpp